jgi:hypothetical protein
MRTKMKQVKAFINRVYRLSLNPKKQETLVWEDLNKLHSDAEWRYGVFEADKYLETVFSIADEIPGHYQYMVFEREFHCLVTVLGGFNPDLTTNVFLLAQHFNNLLKAGVVEVDVNSSTVLYRVKRELLIPLLFNGEIYDQLMIHYNTSKDIYGAYKKLIVDNEEPALIIADLMRNREHKVTEEE